MRRFAPVLQWFGYVFSLGAGAGLVMLIASLLAPTMNLPALAGAAHTAIDPGSALAFSIDPVESPTAEPAPPATSTPIASPSDLWIPSLDLRAPIVAIEPREVTVGGQRVAQLEVPNTFAAGWNASSAPVGSPGNTVLVGHNNEFGEVFRNLDQLVVGDEIVVYADGVERRYATTEVITLPEETVPLADRLANAAWIAPSDDERLTLVTCWPYFTNTHRLVVVARPVELTLSLAP